MTQTPTKDVQQFYTRLIRETAIGIQKKVFEGLEIALSPKSGKELRPVPVYEDEKYSLLLTANIRSPTTLRWATNQSFAYLPAYYKKLRGDDGRLRNEIVVVTNNYCDARFFAAKELMHCFIDDDGYEATNTIELVNDLMESLAVGSANIRNPRNQTIIDEVAWIGAVEYLIPETWIPLMAKIFEAVSAVTTPANAYLHIAQVIRVPELIVRWRLRDATPSK